MSGDFSIRVDTEHNLLHVRMSGFFTVACVQRYRAALDDASRLLQMPAATQGMVNDISEMKIQSQEIVVAFQRVMADPRYAERRVAFVVASTLARMQVSRIIGHRTARLFATTAEAQAWLLERPAAAA